MRKVILIVCLGLAACSPAPRFQTLSQEGAHTVIYDAQQRDLLIVRQNDGAIWRENLPLEERH
jgi:hypothetical protein